MTDHQPDSSKKPYDLSEESSQRKDGDEATSLARKLESDDVNEENGAGAVSIGGDDSGENKVWTSLSED